MRQIDVPELTYRIASALRGIRPATFKDAVSHDQAIKDRARVTIARAVAQALSGLEILTDAPSAPETTFTTPLARMAGERVGTGAPMLD